MVEHIASKPAHKATYATDKRNGGYLIRIAGPHAGAFAGREVPVTRKDDSISKETLERLIWQGKDEKTLAPVALYKFKAKPREEVDEITF
jgi:hypothetical protein